MPKVGKKAVTEFLVGNGKFAGYSRELEKLFEEDTPPRLRTELKVMLGDRLSITVDRHHHGRAVYRLVLRLRSRAVFSCSFKEYVAATMAASTIISRYSSRLFREVQPGEIEIENVTVE